MNLWNYVSMDLWILASLYLCICVSIYGWSSCAWFVHSHTGHLILTRNLWCNDSNNLIIPMYLYVYIGECKAFSDFKSRCAALGSPDVIQKLLGPVARDGVVTFMSSCAKCTCSHGRIWHDVGEGDVKKLTSVSEGPEGMCVFVLLFPFCVCMIPHI
jgi:hypothetical protein